MKCIKAFIIASIVALALTACGADEGTTPSQSPSEDIKNESLADNTGNAAKDIADGAGNIAEDAGDAVKDAGDAVGEGVKDLTK